ncbi:hypothetical protein K3495_g8800 [Podosphaera aphanis]|nr:hypothetical protein K3495_g8800 [Podosphaera aphanis]
MPDDVYNDPDHTRPDLHELREQEKTSLSVPFYTLIHTGETTAHPKQVHYLFSDDDASEVLTAALLQASCEESSLCTSFNNSSDLERSDSKVVPASGISSCQGVSLKKDISANAKVTRCEERAVIVDLNSTGDAVESVTSLSPNWQVLNAQIKNAPTWSGAEANAGSPNGILANMMLKIEGVAYNDFKHTTVPSRKTGADTNALAGEEEMQYLLEQFNHKMATLRRVMGTPSRLNIGGDVMQPKNDRNYEQG